MLYRFADDASLATWEASPQREWWLGAAQGLVGESSIERRTGIEGWFDPPATYDVEDLRPPAPAPPRWKQACVIFLVFFPLSVLANWAAGHTVSGLPLVLRVLCTVLVMTPVMTYVALPWITQRMEWWLRGDRSLDVEVSPPRSRAGDQHDDSSESSRPRPPRSASPPADLSASPARPPP